MNTTQSNGPVYSYVKSRFKLLQVKTDRLAVHYANSFCRALHTFDHRHKTFTIILPKGDVDGS